MYHTTFSFPSIFLEIAGTSGEVKKTVVVSGGWGSEEKAVFRGYLKLGGLARCRVLCDGGRCTPT